MASNPFINPPLASLTPYKSLDRVRAKQRTRGPRPGTGRDLGVQDVSGGLFGLSRNSSLRETGTNEKSPESTGMPGTAKLNIAG